MKTETLLNACLNALNQIPNTRIRDADFKNTYEIASEISKHIKKSKKDKIPYELLSTLESAQSFISGFEGDDSQEDPVDDVLGQLRFWIKRGQEDKVDPIEVYVYVDGGNIHGASATVPITFNVYDKDNYDLADNEERKGMGTPGEWNKMIEQKTKSGEIVGIY